ncbi:MAG: UDP-N-acetylglucosamine 2-epimerase (non-hydrolyzing), partial [Bacteriovoracaceae bacterium]|nr:UDP-N-acetylglucosamine 2-epimerase (non-hydrolyzing) [Bacteriovoracaceae bacterium]
PEIIKMASLIRECRDRKLDYILIHSNQHYSANMDKIFFENLELPSHHYNLEVGSGTHAAQTAAILHKIEAILVDEKVTTILVQGDTNTVMASALAASKLRIKVAHVEAGLRSYDREMPEETNRIVTDNISDYLFAVSDLQANILINEGVSADKIHVVGNTIVDAIHSAVHLSKKSKILDELSLEEKSYYLVTAHRPSNVDEKGSLQEMVDVLSTAADIFDKKIIWPIHPRAKSNLVKFDIDIPLSFKLLDPIGYLDFTCLMSNASAVLTDSGGIQEEACILGVPCITLRENTERPESIDVGANQLVGRDQDKLIAAIKHFSTKSTDWKNPFGDGTSGKQIIDICLQDQLSKNT